MGITTDNATNNITFINLLASWMDGFGIPFDEDEKHFRCFAHAINLGVHKALQKLDAKIKQVCIANLYSIYILLIIVFFIYSYENLLLEFGHLLNVVKD